MNEQAIANLLKVTGMGRFAAEAYLKDCSAKEQAMITAGDVQGAMNEKANRPGPPKKQSGSFVPFSQDKPPAGKPAETPSEAVSEAAIGPDEPNGQ